VGDRGRASGAERSTLPSVVPLRTRPAPWPGLAPRESELWVAIVDAQAVDWFSAGDLPVLAAYVRAIALHERASDECAGAQLTVTGAQGGEIVNPLFRVQDMAAKQIASLAVKLRLTQSSRWTEQKAATKSATTPKKLWER
jgi:phage terminase small subunit